MVYANCCREKKNIKPRKFVDFSVQRFKVFSNSDLFDAYLQLKLEEILKKLVNFNTHTHIFK